MRAEVLNKNSKAPYIIQTVSRALDLLDQFRYDESELGVTELSRRMKLHKNNVFRLLATLEAHDYIEQNSSTGNYHLGLKNLELGQIILRQRVLLRQSRSVLEKLTAESGETSYIAVLKEMRTVYLDGVESSLPLRVVSRLGSSFPAHCTASGKVQIAEFPGGWFAKVYKRQELERCTGKSITDPVLLQTELQQIAMQGYAIEDEELYDGIKCIAAPVSDYTRKIIGAVSISAPSMRLTDQRLADELIPLIIRVTAELSAKLGYR
jgi:DNA-binding IclR family transcriptional regulator